MSMLLPGLPFLTLKPVFSERRYKAKVKTFHLTEPRTSVEMIQREYM